jgi:hypothetical protein
MFSRTRKPSALELEIDRVLAALSDQTIGTKEYLAVLNALRDLHQMKEHEKPSSVSKDTLALIAANLLGIIMIIRHEHINVITSRAMNMVIKAR